MHTLTRTHTHTQDHTSPRRHSNILTLFSPQFPPHYLPDSMNSTCLPVCCIGISRHTRWMFETLVNWLAPTCYHYRGGRDERSGILQAHLTQYRFTSSANIEQNSLSWLRSRGQIVFRYLGNRYARSSVAQVSRIKLLEQNMIMSPALAALWAAHSYRIQKCRLILAAGHAANFSK